MRILLTGGAGFIGHHTVEHILETTDWNLVVLDGLTYAGDVARLTDIDGYDPTRVKVLWHDLRSPIGSGLDDRIGYVDAVIHAAAESHVDNSLARPADFFLANAAITVNMLEWARTRFLTHFIQVSTDEVYGPVPLGRPSREWDPQLPSNPYSGSKSAQEAAAIAWWRSFNVPVVITNTMNNFGERQGPEKFIPKTIKTFLAGEKMTVHGAIVGKKIVRTVKGTDEAVDDWVASSRVWLHARNHADALCFLLQQPVTRYDRTNLWPDRWNVAGDREVDGIEMIGFIARAMGLESWGCDLVDHHSSRPGHDLRYSLDGSKLRMAGWMAPVPFEESLERTVRWTMKRREWLL